MTSREARQTLRTPAGILMMLAVAAPCVSAAQPTLELAADRQRQIIQEIEQEQSRTELDGVDQHGVTVEFDLKTDFRSRPW